MNTITSAFPCCGKPLLLPIDDTQYLPYYQEHTCPHCGADCWTKVSKYSPTSWTAADFEQLHEIDEQGAVVPRRLKRQAEEGAKGTTTIDDLLASLEVLKLRYGGTAPMRVEASDGVLMLRPV